MFQLPKHPLISQPLYLHSHVLYINKNCKLANRKINKKHTERENEMKYLSNATDVSFTVINTWQDIVYFRIKLSTKCNMTKLHVLQKWQFFDHKF